ncbi:hypothetical protein [Pseudopontixanthobacter vadosimaris]|uniref:hypothetical protein n=1 Tax=Pseudopontixanthobacter vadosimaris TaxID=2726450 RepID=UPI0014760363|nr:hypothetical protein [Pseudopontixanthobacter vadosimaris]
MILPFYIAEARQIMICGPSWLSAVHPLESVPTDSGSSQAERTHPAQQERCTCAQQRAGRSAYAAHILRDVLTDNCSYNLANHHILQLFTSSTGMMRLSFRKISRPHPSRSTHAQGTTPARRRWTFHA